MDTVLVGIHFPIVRMNYDALLPKDVPIKNLVGIINDGIIELSNGKYTPSGLEMMFMKDPETLMKPECTLQDYQIKDGMQLYFL